MFALFFAHWLKRLALRRRFIDNSKSQNYYQLVVYECPEKEAINCIEKYVQDYLMKNKEVYHAKYFEEIQYSSSLYNILIMVIFIALVITLNNAFIATKYILEIIFE